MKKTYFKRAIALMLLLCCLSLTSVYADVTQDDIDDAKEQVDDLQNQVEDAKNALNEINNHLMKKLFIYSLTSNS